MDSDHDVLRHLCLAILENPGSDKERVTWHNDESGRLESRLAEVAIQIVLTAELQHRETAVRRYQWRVERKAQLEEEERERERKAERAECERKKRIAQSRIDRLLKDAAAFQQVGAIRKYVDAIRLAVSNSEACSPDGLERSSLSVLSEADRIDPAIGGMFLNVLRDEGHAQEEGTPCTESLPSVNRNVS